MELNNKFFEMIPGLEKVFEGKPKLRPKKVILIAGKPGAMKTSVLTTFLSNVVELEGGNSGMYITLEEKRDSILEGMDSIGLIKLAKTSKGLKGKSGLIIWDLVTLLKPNAQDIQAARNVLNQPELRGKDTIVQLAELLSAKFSIQIISEVIDTDSEPAFVDARKRIAKIAHRPQSTWDSSDGVKTIPKSVLDYMKLEFAGGIHHNYLRIILGKLSELAQNDRYDIKVVVIDSLTMLESFLVGSNKEIRAELNNFFTTIRELIPYTFVITEGEVADNKHNDFIKQAYFSSDGIIELGKMKPKRQGGKLKSTRWFRVEKMRTKKFEDSPFYMFVDPEKGGVEIGEAIFEEDDE